MRSARIILAAFLLGTVVSSGSTPQPGNNPSGPRVDALFIGCALDPSPYWDHFVSACARDGVHCYMPPGRADRNWFTMDHLTKFQVIVVQGTIGKAETNMRGVYSNPGLLTVLDQYYRAGGGIIWVPFGQDPEQGGKNWNDLIGSRYDATGLLGEQLYDPAKMVSVVPGQNEGFYHYIWTTDITADPVTEGVDGLLLSMSGEHGWPGTVPMKFGKSWRTLIRAMDSTSTIGNATPDAGYEPTFKPEIKGSYGSSPEIVGVRDSIGESGRMMVYPFYVTATWGNFGHWALKDAMMLNGCDGYRSEGLRLFLNGCDWVAAPATKAGFGGYEPPPAVSQKPDLTPVDWSKVTIPRKGPPQFRGLFGAQTALGGGTGSVADYVKEAKRLGLQFIVFLDDLQKIDDARYAKLVADCTANTNANFAAVPGYLYRDTAGTLEFAFDAKRLPSPLNMTPDRRVRAESAITTEPGGFECGIGISALGKMKLDINYLALFTAIAPYMYQDGKLVDDGFNAFRHCEGVGHLYPLISLTLMSSPAEMAKTVSQAHVTVLRTDDMWNYLSGRGRDQAHPTTYITNGPKIEIWGDGARAYSRPFVPGGESFRLGLRVSSPAGLKEVRIVDARTGLPYRRFDAHGAKEFTCQMDESHKTIWYLIPVVTDMNGRTAVGSTFDTEQSGCDMRMMGDRLMGYCGVTVWDARRRALTRVTSWIGGDIVWAKCYGTAGAGWAPVNSRNEELIIHGIDGAKVFGSHADVIPCVVMNEATEPKIPAWRFQSRICGFDYSVMDFLGDAEFLKPTPHSIPGLSITGWAYTPDPQVPNKYADILARTSAVRPRYHAAVSANVNDVFVTFKAPCTLKRIQLAQAARSDNTPPLLFMARDGEGESAWMIDPRESFHRAGTLAPGDYVFLANDRGGAGGFVNMGPGPLKYEQSGMRCRLYVDGAGRQMKPGDRITARFLTFMKPWPGQRTNEWLRKFIADYAIGGGKPGYGYNITQGKLRTVNYALELDAENGGAIAEVNKYNLPHNLLERVWGIPANAVAGRYDLDRKQLMILPVFENTATTSVNTTLGDTRLYVGELFHCDNPRLLLSAVQDSADQLMVEVHNPTYTVQEAALTQAPGFPALSGLPPKVNLAPGTSEKFTLETAAGTLRYTPYEGD